MIKKKTDQLLLALLFAFQTRLLKGPDFLTYRRTTHTCKYAFSRYLQTRTLGAPRFCRSCSKKRFALFNYANSHKRKKICDHDSEQHSGWWLQRLVVTFFFFCFCFEDVVRLIWQRGEIFFFFIFSGSCWICLFPRPLHSCTTINMEFYFICFVFFFFFLMWRLVFLFMHVDMTRLVFIPVFISLYWFVDKKNIYKKTKTFWYIIWCVQ